MADEKYEPMEKHKKKFKQANKILDTTNVEHSKAHIYAIDEVLRDKEGNIDYDMLKETTNQLKFADKMAQHYIKKAKERLKSDISEKDEFESELLMKAYANVTKAELRRYVAHEKDKFTFDLFEQKYKPKFMNSLMATLHSAAAAHLTEEHVGDIVKYMKLDDILDREYLTRESAVAFLSHYHAHEPHELSRGEIEKIIQSSEGSIPERVLKKPKGKGKKKKAA